MENEDQIGYAFPIICPRHPSEAICLQARRAPYSWLPKVVASGLVNFVWHVDMCAHRWYVLVNPYLPAIAPSLKQGNYSVTPTKTTTEG
jgi:hypothetical protein